MRRDSGPARSSDPTTPHAPGAPAAGAAGVMGVLFLVFFLGVSDNQMISPLLPHIARDFNLEAGDAGQLLGPAYAFAAACAALLIGPASDKHGRRRFLLAACFLFAASLLVVGVVKNIALLAVVRFFTGFAAGTFSTCSIAYVGDFFPYQRRGTAMSVVQSGYSAALVAGVLGGAALAQWKGWRWSFMAFGVLSLIVFVLILTLLPDDREAAKSHAGAGLPGRFHNIRAAITGRDRIAAIASAFFVSAGFTGFLLYIGTWLATSFNLPTTRVSMVFMLAGVASLVGGIAAGPVADRFGKQRLSLLSSAVLAVTLIVIPRLGWGAALFGCFLVAALAFAFRQGPIQALATELVPRAVRGTLVAVRNTASQVGTAAATAGCGLLFDRHGYGAVGTFSAAMTVAAVICIAFMREPNEQPAAGSGQQAAKGHERPAGGSRVTNGKA